MKTMTIEDLEDYDSWKCKDCNQKLKGYDVMHFVKTDKTTYYIGQCDDCYKSIQTKDRLDRLEEQCNKLFRICFRDFTGFR